MTIIQASVKEEERRYEFAATERNGTTGLQTNEWKSKQPADG